MKRKFIELQLFAEEGGDGNDGGQQGNQQQGEGQQSGKSGEGNNSKPEPKYTDEDVDKLFNKKFAEWEKKKQKEIDEAKKLAEMNAQERAEHERDELQKKLDALEKKDTLSEMTKTARKMLMASSHALSKPLCRLTKTPTTCFIRLHRSSVGTSLPLPENTISMENSCNASGRANLSPLPRPTTRS